MHVDPSSLAVPAPTTTTESEPYWQACRDGRFVLQRCDDCGAWVFYPRVLCPSCWSMALTWRPASGTGAIRSFSTVHKPGHPGWIPAVPYTVAVITLTEGPTMLTTLIGIAPEDVRVGLPVEVAFTTVGEFTLPFFRPREASGPEKSGPETGVS